MTGTLLLACCLTLAWVIADSAGRVPNRPAPGHQVLDDRWLDAMDWAAEDDDQQPGPVSSSLDWSGRPGRVRHSRRARRRRVTSRRPRGMRPAGPRPRTARVH